jgi:Arc/MetJ-type ribon-helix-helix transcriptional regulator
MTKDKSDKKSETTETKEDERHNPLEDLGNQVEKFAVRTAESIKKVIDKALASRNTVLTIRVNDESNQRMNMLVDSGLFKSRSESAAFLIQEGIRSREDLFGKIEGKLKKMEKIKEELKSIVSEEMDETP